MEWHEDLDNIHKAISTESGRRLFKSILMDILGTSSKIETTIIIYTFVIRSK